jgi:hypothetical protein
VLSIGSYAVARLTFQASNVKAFKLKRITMTKIKDVNGLKLKLGKKYLTELEPSTDAEYGTMWRTKLADLYNGEDAPLTQVNDTEDAPKGTPGNTLEDNDFEERSIGCHTFDVKTFALIKRAIKAAQKNQ